MIKMGKRIAAILVTVCICVSLTACANDEGFERKYTIDNPWWSTTGELRKEDNNVVFDDVDVNLTTVVTGADYVGFKDNVDLHRAHCTAGCYSDFAHRSFGAVAQYLYVVYVHSDAKIADIFR